MRILVDVVGLEVPGEVEIGSVSDTDDTALLTYFNTSVELQGVTEAEANPTPGVQPGFILI